MYSLPNKLSTSFLCLVEPELRSLKDDSYEICFAVITVITAHHISSWSPSVTYRKNTLATWKATTQAENKNLYLERL